MFGFFKRKKKNEIVIDNSEINVDSDPIEVFMNSSKDKYGELYYKNGCYTYIIMEKLFDDYEGHMHYYWCPAQAPASFFDTKEKAIEGIMSIIESKEMEW